MSNLDTYQTRSWLFTPATRSDRFAKAAENGADVAIIDLEDSVSQADKEQARQKPSLISLHVRLHHYRWHYGSTDWILVPVLRIFTPYSNVAAFPIT